MIVGRLDRWRDCVGSAPIWTVAFEALAKLTPDAAEKELPLRDGAFLRVMSYPTRDEDDPQARLEAHLEMVDIQLTLVGAERIDWYPAELLEEQTPYDAERDVRFYKLPGTPPHASLQMQPGTFTILYPEDAHRPQLRANTGEGQVKKVVVKVPVSTLG